MPIRFPIYCVECGKYFLSQLARTRRCAPCARRYNATVYLQAFNKERKSHRINSACAVCGQISTDPPSRKRVVCSNTCRSEWAYRRQLGAQSHRWKGGRTAKVLLKRMSLPGTQWRERVFRRDDYVCQLCYTRGGRLTAHHIIEVNKREDKMFDTSNGITLCWPCHRSIRQSEAKYVSRFTVRVRANERARQRALL